jgi:hypothetical protein
MSLGATTGYDAAERKTEREGHCSSLTMGDNPMVLLSI